MKNVNEWVTEEVSKGVRAGENR